MEPDRAAPSDTARPAPASGFNLPLAYLRAFVTLLVVVHHAVLGYSTLAPRQAVALATTPRTWAAFPVVDPAKAPVLDLLISFDDISVMSMMFLLSGTFVWASLAKRGPRAYLTSRAVRLGVPFVVVACLVAPLAYLPAYLLMPGPRGLAGFVTEWGALGSWPSGPAWFLWVLLAFDALATLAFVTARGACERLGARCAALAERPWLALALLTVFTGACYVPMSWAFGPFRWFGAIVFYLQACRALHYLGYFAFGVVTGMAAGASGLLSPEGALARSHVALIVLAVPTFGGAIALFAASFASPTPALVWAARLLFPVVCATSSFAFLAVFLARVRVRRALCDDFAACAYGVFVVHYPFTSWLPYLLLPVALPPLAKAAIAAGASLVASWALVKALRLVPGVTRIL